MRAYQGRVDRTDKVWKGSKELLCRKLTRLTYWVCGRREPMNWISIFLRAWLLSHSSTNLPDLVEFLLGVRQPRFGFLDGGLVHPLVFLQSLETVDQSGNSFQQSGMPGLKMADMRRGPTFGNLFRHVFGQFRERSSFRLKVLDLKTFREVSSNTPNLISHFTRNKMISCTDKAPICLDMADILR